MSKRIAPFCFSNHNLYKILCNGNNCFDVLGTHHLACHALEILYLALDLSESKVLQKLRFPQVPHFSGAFVFPIAKFYSSSQAHKLIIKSNNQMRVVPLIVLFFSELWLCDNLFCEHRKPFVVFLLRSFSVSSKAFAAGILRYSSRRGFSCSPCVNTDPDVADWPLFSGSNIYPRFAPAHWQHISSLNERFLSCLAKILVKSGSGGWERVRTFSSCRSCNEHRVPG